MKKINYLSFIILSSSSSSSSPNHSTVRSTASHSQQHKHTTTANSTPAAPISHRRRPPPHRPLRKPNRNEETVKFGSEAMDETLGTKKKKVRVVKKIVKKKVIKKVPKRPLTASDCNNCNDLGKIASSSPNFSDVDKIASSRSNVSVSVASNCDDINKIASSSPNSSDLGKIASSSPNFGVSVASSCDDLDKGESFSPNFSTRVEIGKPNVEIGDMKEGESVNELKIDVIKEGKHNVDIDDIKEVENVNELKVDDIKEEKHNVDVDVDDIKEVENVNELAVSDMEECGYPVGTSESFKDASQVSGLVTSRVLGDPVHDERQDGDQNRVELVDSEVDGLKAREGLSEGDVVSGKVVASRLYMRRMSKIFIHGLGQETKEEDIRKVFEEVGEVVEVKMITNFRSGRNRGCGFVRFASVELANLALTKYQNVEICGRLCHTAAIEGVDTILLNNIDKKWNNKNVVELLQKVGINKIDEVLVVPDPDNTELNCGFAYLEFETKKDAQMAYHKLQNENVFGKHSNIKVSWASPSVDPVEEEIHNSKSVYAENIPLSWDEKEVNNHFKMYGEIESIALAKNLRTAKRNDFAFINYKTCEAALSCIEALTCKKSTINNGPKGHLKVSLSKSMPKVKPTKTVSDSAVTVVSKAYQKPNQSRQSPYQYQTAYQPSQLQQHSSLFGVYKAPQTLNNMIGKHEDSRKDLASSTTAELVQLLREQASWKQGGPSSTAGMSTVHHQTSSVGKQPFTELGSNSLYHHDPRAYHPSHLQVPNVTHPRPVASMTSFPSYDQQRTHYMPGSVNVVRPDPRYFQIKDQTTYPGSSSIYRQKY